MGTLVRLLVRYLLRAHFVSVMTESFFLIGLHLLYLKPTRWQTLHLAGIHVQGLWGSAKGLPSPPHPRGPDVGLVAVPQPL